MARSVFSLVLILFLITPLSCKSLPAERPEPGEGGARVQAPPGPETLSTSSATALDPLARTVEIRRTSYGVPHILAEELGGAGYGLAWVMMEDYREEVARAILRSNGRWGLGAATASGVISPGGWPTTTPPGATTFFLTMSGRSWMDSPGE